MDTNRIEGDVNNSGEGGEGEKETGRVKKRAVTIFLRKKNKAVGTLPLHTETEEEIKYILIMKMQWREKLGDLWENMEKFIVWEAKLSKESKEKGAEFDKVYRLLMVE